MYSFDWSVFQQHASCPAKCLQGLGLLAQGPKPNTSQWTALVKTIYGRITGLIASIEEEDRAGGHAKSLNERIKDRTVE